MGSVSESRVQMAVTQQSRAAMPGSLAFDPAGVAWFLLAVVAALPLFWIGFVGLAAAWVRPEYSHGPVIPLLSFYIFLREMRDVPPVGQPVGQPGGQPVTDRGRGVLVVGLALSIAALGNLVNITDIVFYALIVWIFGLVLTLLRGAARHRLLAVGAAPRLHAAAAAVPLLALQHRAAARLLGDRRLAGRRDGGAGLSRRQHHRPRGLQAAGGRGLLGAALPLPDHELLLRLRGALPRARSGTRWCCSPRRSRSRC